MSICSIPSSKYSEFPPNNCLYNSPHPQTSQHLPSKEPHFRWRGPFGTCWFWLVREARTFAFFSPEDAFSSDVFFFFFLLSSINRLKIHTRHTNCTRKTLSALRDFSSRPLFLGILTQTFLETKKCFPRVWKNFFNFIDWISLLGISKLEGFFLGSLENQSWF